MRRNVLIGMLFVIMGIAFLVYGLLPKKNVEVVVAKARYIETTSDNRHTHNNKQKVINYYAHFDMDGQEVEVYLGSSAKNIERDENDMVVLYRAEDGTDWHLSEATARASSKLFFIIVGSFATFLSVVYVLMTIVINKKN